MKHEPIDPKRERLIAYLYGEMTEEESNSFVRLLETDSTLREEFEELRGAREILSGWRVPEPTPSFVFLNETAGRHQGAAKWWERFSFLRGMGGFGLGLATAGAAALILAFTGFRMERVDGGFAFRFGEEQQTALPAAQRLDQFERSGTRSEPLELANTPPGTMPGAAAASSSEYITRDEFEKLSSQMVGSVVDLLNEYGNSQNHEVTGILQAMYADLSDRQSRDSEEIRHRMSALGVELLLRQAKSKPSSGDLRMQPTSANEETDLVSPWKTLDWKEEQR
jgi:hypothetical protein